MTMKEQTHFDKIYWYILIITAFILLYVGAITFLPIPKENQRFVDISLAFLLGFMSSAAAFLTGGTPTANKKTGETGTTTAEFTASVTTEPVTDKPNDSN